MVLKRFLKTIQDDENSFQVARSFQAKERLKTVPEKSFKCDIDSNCCFWKTLSKEKFYSDFRSDDREHCSQAFWLDVVLPEGG